MIRIIVRTSDCGEAANVGGPVDVSFRTFDVELPEVEAFLVSVDKYMTKRVMGVEIAAARKA